MEGHLFDEHKGSCRAWTKTELQPGRRLRERRKTIGLMSKNNSSGLFQSCDMFKQAFGVRAPNVCCTSDIIIQLIMTLSIYVHAISVIRT